MGCSGSKPEDAKAPTKASDRAAAASGASANSAKTPGSKTPESKTIKPGVSDRERDKEAAKQENKGYQETMSFLSQVQLLKRLPKDQHPMLAAACVPVEFKAGQVVIKQGDAGSEFFVIKSGEARVEVSQDGESPLQVAALKSGDYFGENALLSDEPRTATITADTALSTLKITRELFQKLGLNEKLQFANRKAVGGGMRKQNLAKAPSPKTEEERTLMTQALKSNHSLQTMVDLNDARIKQIIDVAWKEDVPANKEVIVEGDLQADFFYIVQEGKFEIYVTDHVDDAGSNNDREGNAVLDQADKSDHSIEAETSVGSKSVGTVARGGSFGELALLYLVPRAATVKAVQDSVVWVIDRTNFKEILMKVSDEKIQEYVQYISHVEMLNPLLTDEKKAVAQALVEMHFVKDEVVLQQGELGNTFYILYQGEVRVLQDGAETKRLTASQAHGTTKFFGERALLNNEPRSATVVVKSEIAKALALDRESFNLLLGPLEDIIKRSQADAERPSFRSCGDQQQAAMFAGKGMLHDGGTKVDKKDLTRVGLLGCGGFGAVELWEHKHTHQTYALKGLSKGYVVETDMQESVMNEKAILMMTNSPFIIKLHATFNGSSTLYFLLEPAMGGELYATYNRRGFHGSERHAKYYVAGVVFAFEHLHERHIIYRDLKPENLLFTDKGHLKVTDMGLAKFVIGKTYTCCGTPDYFAPELIASTGHTNAVDWWGLGILLFELMSGHPPFESTAPLQIYSKVMKGINQVPFPSRCQGSVGALIKSLLKKDPSERLPMRPGGTKNLKEAKWYQGFNWDAMEKLELEPPYKPTVKSKKDIANFYAREKDMPKRVEYKDDGSGWDRDFAS